MPKFGCRAFGVSGPPFPPVWPAFGEPTRFRFGGHSLVAKEYLADTFAGSVMVRVMSDKCCLMKIAPQPLGGLVAL